MSHGSKSVMTGWVVLAVLLCAQTAVGQTRPVLSEVFQSPVVVQITTGAGADAVTVDGVGQVTFNTPIGQARQFYVFENGRLIDIITRYDLGKIFTIRPPRCEVEEVTGPMPPFFAWVANAKQGAADKVLGITGTTWVGSQVSPLQTLLANNAGTIPLYYQESTPERTVRIIFLHYQTTFKQKPDLFKPPRRCPN